MFWPRARIAYVGGHRFFLQAVSFTMAPWHCSCLLAASTTQVVDWWQEERVARNKRSSRRPSTAMINRHQQARAPGPRRLAIQRLPFFILVLLAKIGADGFQQEHQHRHRPRHYHAAASSTLRLRRMKSGTQKRRWSVVGRYPIDKGRASRNFPPFHGANEYHGARSASALSVASSLGSVGAPASSTVSALQQALHANPSYCLTVVLLLSAFGISLERRTTVGKALSAPLATMALALTVANLGAVPFSSPIYGMVNRYLVPLAVPMLLYDSDLRRVVRDTGSLLLAFLVGAFATVVATLVTYPIIPLRSLGSDGWKVASALAARHIGGAINFVAVAETLKIAGTSVSSAIASDNVVVAIYFAILFALAGPSEPDDKNDDIAALSSSVSADSAVIEESEEVSTESELEYHIADDETNGAKIQLPSLVIALSVSSSLVTVGGFLTTLLLPTGTSALPLTSLLTVVVATAFPKFFSRIREAGQALGVICIQMFFAASGASGSIALVLRQAPSLFAFSMLQIAVHFGVLMTIGRGIFRLPARELYLSSNANVGGPTTAAAMAQAKNWKRLVLPALLVGILGYASATAIALALGPVLLKLPLLSR